MRALHTAATGMMAQELNVQVISNNIANMRTTGYKRQRAEFQDLLYEHVRRVGTQTSDQGNILPAGVELGAGVKTVGTPRMMTQGNLLPTDKPLDVAIRGEGFFKITPARRPHRLHARRLVRARRAGPHRHRAGLRAAARPDHRAERQEPDRQFAGPGLGDAAGRDHERPWSARSSLRCSSTSPACRRSATTCSSRRRPPARRRTARRASTVSATCSRATSSRRTSRPVKEISDLIAAQRAYEMNAKVITATDQMLQSTSQMLR